jgi:non-specific serine/threonine protein kinase
LLSIGGQALDSLAQFQHLRGSGFVVEHLASVAGTLGYVERAARLLGAAEMLFDLSNQVPFPPLQLAPEKIAATCQERLGEKAFAAAFAAGRGLSVGRAQQYALEPDASSHRSSRARALGPLTRREREIAGLVAQGLSNRQIAEALAISEKTAESHLSHILSKLELPSRTRLAVWAAEEGLPTAEV